jgi:hypothetical protein
MTRRKLGNMFQPTDVPHSKIASRRNGSSAWNGHSHRAIWTQAE